MIADGICRGIQYVLMQVSLSSALMEDMLVVFRQFMVGAGERIITADFRYNAVSPK